MHTRFAFDLGTNSIGWAVFRIARTPDPDRAKKAGEPDPWRPVELLGTGARIFSDGRNPQDKESLAKLRRGPRSARRRRDRYLQRRKKILARLTEAGLFPADPAAHKALEKRDPFELRARGLDEKLAPEEIGRALFHLSQRRGFKSNRLTDRASDDKESGKIDAAARALAETLAANDCRTLGEWLARRQANPYVRRRHTVRARLTGTGAQARYAFYPTRKMVEEEFDALWDAQAAHYPERMNDAVRATIHDAIFFQRPLKPVPVGKCRFLPEHPRAPVALPLAQRVRILQEVNNIRLLLEAGLTTRPLTEEERRRLTVPLLAGEDLKFSQIRKLLRLDSTVEINLEAGGRKGLDGNHTVKLLTKAYKKKPPPLTPERWAAFDRPTQEGIVRACIGYDDKNPHKLITEHEALVDLLINRFGLTVEEAEAAANAPFDDGHASLSTQAMERILPGLEAGLIHYEAAKAAGFQEDEARRPLDRLPYYGELLEASLMGGSGNPEDGPVARYGRFPNPTVHIALNQLRRVVNGLIETYGKPTQIVLELGRDLKNSQDDREKIAKQNKKNEAHRKVQEKRMREEAGLFDPRPADFRKMRLWEELPDRQSVYSGRTISIKALFSAEVEIEHILPFSKTLDNSMANKTLAFREENRGKRDRAPAEAWTGAEYEAIAERAKGLPPNKRWRFLPDAMDRFRKDERNFLDRQLMESRWVSRLARQYVLPVADENQVWVVTGQLTALLRRRWGLQSVLSDHNAKNRDDHRHHAVDACTVGAIDRSLLNTLARKAGQQEMADALDDITKDVPPPYERFRDQVASKVRAILVSHKQEHGTVGAGPNMSAGKLHEETAYGLVRNEDAERGNLVVRKPIVDLKPGEIAMIRDDALRAKVEAEVAGTGDDKARRNALEAFAAKEGIRRVRYLKDKAAKPIVDKRTGKPYKAVIPGEVMYIDIVRLKEGSWKGFGMTLFDAHTAVGNPPWQADHPTGKLIMRLYKNDTVAVTDNGFERIMRVVQLKPSTNRIVLAEVHEGGTLDQRDKDPDDRFKWDFATISKLRDRNARKVTLDALGRIRE